MSDTVPIVKWAGGKRAQVDRLIELFGEGKPRVYHEPFLGGGALFFALASRDLIGPAILSDINPKLIEMYRAVQGDVESVIEELLQLGTDDWQNRYKAVRQAYNDGPPVGAKHAARFLWLNRACFNGLYRENKAGRFNVPVGDYETLSLQHPSHLRAASALLQRAVLVARGFADQLSLVERGDWVYCDPPYVPASDTANFTAYAAGGFSLDQHRQLASACWFAARMGARILVSNSDTELCRTELYAPKHGWTIELAHTARRSISRGKRVPVGEIIVSAGGPNHHVGGRDVAVL